MQSAPRPWIFAAGNKGDPLLPGAFDQNEANASYPRFAGTQIQTAEFTALLEAFGRLDDQNRRYLTVDDVRGLWLEGRYPAGWSARPPDAIDAVVVAKAATGMSLRRLWDSVVNLFR